MYLNLSQIEKIYYKIFVALFLISDIIIDEKDKKEETCS